MEPFLSYFINRCCFLLRYVLYEITYYLIGGEAIIHDILFKSKNKCEPESRPGHVAVVTGGARGIGANLVKKFLQCDMQVIICCRNPAAADKLIKKIREDGVSSGTTRVYELDLISLKSVESCAQAIRRDFNSINILVNNAGIMFPPYSETESGLESQWGVNYVAPFLLSHLLFPLLENCSSGPARIVNVSSCAHTAAQPINFNNLNMKDCYIPSKNYAQSKLAQVLFSLHLDRELRARGSKVRVYAVHPGVVDTDIFNGTALRILFPWILTAICKTADEGATTVLHAAISADLEERSGVYLSNCTVQPPSKLAQNTKLQSDLFAYTLKVLNISEFGKVLD